MIKNMQNTKTKNNNNNNFSIFCKSNNDLIIFSREYSIHVIIFHYFGELLGEVKYLYVKKLPKCYAK